MIFTEAKGRHESGRVSQDLRVTWHGAQDSRPLRGDEKHVAIDGRFSDGERRLFWPADLVEISSTQFCR
jgi:hypothetical protein